MQPPDELLLRLFSTYHELFIPLIIADVQLIRPAAHLTILDIFLLGSLAGVHKSVIGLAAVGAAVGGGSNFAFINGVHNFKPSLK